MKAMGDKLSDSVTMTRLNLVINYLHVFCMDFLFVKNRFISIISPS